MVPVRLELQNFLSYGTAAPALEFNDFEVACLSGGNGEGKSALLDAITWALWGEARKSSGKRKPDDELIRIGSRHMEVTFTFDLEGTRYRVTRSFSRSATGKTTSSDLEFQLFDPEDDEYRPLTGATQRETQGRIEDTLGLDYDTFINSAFLLQGRSDEFTDKSPSQRKEILVSILNLSRYEQLEDKARDRWREAKKRQQRTEAEVERLEEAVADVPEWEEKRAEVQADIEAQQERVAELREREKSLTQAVADLEAKAREREAARSALEDLDDRIGNQEDTLESLNEKIAQADELLDEQEEIEAAYERYQSLQEERDALDEKRDLHRGLEKQIEQVESSLRERTNTLERRLDRLKVERKNLKRDLDECETQLAQRSAVEEHLREAQAARQTVREWEAVRDRRDRLKEQQQEARRALVGVQQQLKGELDALQEQIADEEEAVSALEDLDERIDTLSTKKEKRSQLDEQLQELEAKGKTVGQHIQELEGQLDARREERDQDQAELQRFRAADGPTCPTCGTELTPSHRQEVESTLQSSIDELEESIREGEEQLQELSERRTELRQQYAQLRKKGRELDGVEEALATAREQRRSLQERAEQKDVHRQQALALQQKLQHRTYGAEHRRRWQWCAQRRAALQFDPEHFDSLQNRAAQLDRYTERLRELNELDGRREELQRKIREHNEEIETLRTELEDGTAFEELKDRRETLQQQLEDVDFDPERFQEVRQAFKDLSHVPDRRSELKNAENNRSEWVEQRAQVRDQIEALKEERQDKREEIETLNDALEKKASLDEEVESVEKELEAAEESLTDAQQTLGMLSERLDQAQRDREDLEEARDTLEACKDDRQLYKHLRTVFGKHGIPSLIIEETLPEIEERANRILDRLTDGRMHVRLETLKEKKSGGTKETLDIIITDEQGVPRPYETYSGGESFRVNFALRVALAQLLADRSGVRVRTLVIDEGFGTQDETGIERLVEAIQAIRDDFAKIIVITHLQRLKQAFPVRIEVEKDPAIGSTFEVVGA